MLRNKSACVSESGWERQETGEAQGWGGWMSFRHAPSSSKIQGYCAGEIIDHTICSYHKVLFLDSLLLLVTFSVHTFPNYSNPAGLLTASISRKWRCYEMAIWNLVHSVGFDETSGTTSARLTSGVTVHVPSPFQRLL